MARRTSAGSARFGDVWVLRRVSRRLKHGIHVPERDIQRSTEAQHHVHTRARATGLEKAHMTARDVGPEREVQLAQSSLAAPLLEERGEQSGA
jgi:hypothetical protein